MKEVKLIQGYKSGHWSTEWQVWYGNTMLLHTTSEDHARAAYERYKQNPPNFGRYRIPEIIF